MSWDHPHAPNEGKSSEWWTPPHIFDALNIDFDLDPCAPSLPAASWIPALKRFSSNGLGLTWFGRVWLNPPYGKSTGIWLDRLVEHNNGIALVFARTDVRWWHRALPSASAVCFIEGRITFIAGTDQSAPGNSGGPSALIAYGKDCAIALDHSNLGLVWQK